MEQILIYKPNGDSEAINSNSLVSVITQAEHKKALLGEDVINMIVESATVRNFAIGDYIQVLGLPKYRINQLPKVSKESERKYVYDLIFEGLQYDLLRVAYRNTDVSNFNDAADFSLIGDIEMFLNVIINNLNRVFGADKWTLGDFPEETETKNLLFSNENCLGVLQRLCEEYKYQFVCQEDGAQNILHVRESGIDLDYNFKYGQGKGLYKLSRENVDTKNLVNTLWAYGGSKNLPADYKGYSPRLRLGIDADLPLLDADSRAAYGVFEGSVIFDEIYPKRTGTVSAIITDNRLQFKDSGMNFDLKAKSGENTLYLIPGNSAKVRFQTGNLAGYEFEVTDYVHSTKTFTISVNKDQKGLELPSSTESAFQIALGDTYIIVDIVMPQAYINAAEEDLLIKATEYLDNNSVPTVKYNLELDEFFIRDTAGSEHVFEIGDTVNIEDTALGINTRIKIIEFTRDILRPFKYSLTIKDIPQISTLRTIVVQNHYNRNFLKLFGLDDPVKAKTDWKSGNEILSEIIPRIKKVLTETQIDIGREDGDSDIDLKGNIKITTRDFGIYNPDLGKDIFKIDTGGNSIIGADETFTKVIGGFGLQNGDGFIGNFSMGDITEDRVYSLPNYSLTINNWPDLANVPDTFPPSPHTHTISDITGLTTALNNKQPLDGDLTAIAAMTGTGFIKRVGTNTWTVSDNLVLGAGSDIYIGSDRFIHNYNNFSPSANTFMGINSGNLTMVMEENDGIDNGIKNGLNMYGGNTAFGYYSLNSIYDGGYNVAIGSNAMRYSAGTYSSVAIGTQALMHSIDGDYNTAVGQDAGKFIGGAVLVSGVYVANGGDNTHSNNTLIGAKAGLYLRGTINTYIGTHAGEWNTGNYNIGIGIEVLQNNTGANNIGIGRQALHANTAAGNVGIGEVAAYNNTSGDYGVFLGSNAGFSNTTGSRNVRIGGYNSYLSTTGGFNVALGYGANYANVTGSNNIILGYNALNVSTAGSENIAIGTQAGGLGDWGDSSINIGYFAGRNTNGGNHSINIGRNAGTLDGANVYKLNISMLSTPLISGDFSAGQVGINVANSALTHTLTVNGSIYAKGITPLKLDSTIGYFQNSIVATLFGSGADFWFTPGQASSGYLFQTKNASNIAINAMAINRDGNVGIGISNATQKLHIFDAGNVSALIQSSAIASLRLTGGTHGQILNTANNMYITNQSAVGFIHLQTNSTSRLVILVDGKVGINQAAPTYQLDVNGTFRAAGAAQFDAIASCPIAPTSANHLVNKAYVDSLALVKRGDAVSAVFNANVSSLSGVQNAPGYIGVMGEKYLLIGQTSAQQNGVWIMNAGAWTRPTTADSDSELRGAYHFVLAGDYANYRFINTNSSALTVWTSGTTSGFSGITYDIDFGAETDPVWSAFKTANNIDPTHIDNWNTSYSWGNHALAGYVPSLRILTINGTSGRIDITGGGDLTTDRTWTIDLSSSGVTAGVYTQLTVDTYGRVTAASNPTTLSGYGITDGLSVSAAASTYQTMLSGTGLVRSTAGVITYDSSTYLTESLADDIYIRQDDATGGIDLLDVVTLVSDTGERGFKLYAIETDNQKRFAEAFFFVNPDSGVLGIHAYRQDGSDTKAYGLEVNKDGFLYHLRDDLTRHRLLTTNDLGSLTWSGGHVTNDINIDTYLNMYWGKVTGSDYDARLFSSKSSVTGQRGFYIDSNGSISIAAHNNILALGSGKYPGGTVGDHAGVVIDGVMLDLQGAQALLGGTAKFQVSYAYTGNDYQGPYLKLSLIAG